jgi:hypothetical protein
MVKRDAGDLGPYRTPTKPRRARRGSSIDREGMFLLAVIGLVALVPIGAGIAGASTLGSEASLGLLGLAAVVRAALADAKLARRRPRGGELFRRDALDRL